MRWIAAVRIVTALRRDLRFVAFFFVSIPITLAIVVGAIVCSLIRF